MYRTLIVALIAGTSIVSGAAMAQQSEPTMMPETGTEPMHSSQNMMQPRTTRASRGSCFDAAMQFDHILQQKVSGLDVAKAAAMFDEATQLRNVGIQQCQSGNRAAGVQQIERAIQALQS